MRNAGLGLLALALSACAQGPSDSQWRPIAVSATPAQLGAERAGVLRFVGGVELKSETAAFGGLSDIHIASDGAFLAITDAGFFVRGKLTLDADGAPSGVTDASIAAMLDEQGAPFTSKEQADSEGMAVADDGTVWVSFEQRQLLRHYAISDAGVSSARRGPALAGAADLPANGGLEALSTAANGDLFVGAEDGGALWFARPGAQTPAPRRARIALGTGFGLVELDRLPSGDYVGLERFYAPVVGNRIRVVRLFASDLTANPPSAPKQELALLSNGLALDNFEGVSAVPWPDGSVRLFIVSDDNFNARQRTLIYVFALDERGPQE